MTNESEGKSKHLTIRLTESEHRRVKILAAEEGTTIKDLVLGCIDRLIEERRERQLRNEEDRDA